MQDNGTDYPASTESDAHDGLCAVAPDRCLKWSEVSREELEHVVSAGPGMNGSNMRPDRMHSDAERFGCLCMCSAKQAVCQDLLLPSCQLLLFDNHCHCGGKDPDTRVLHLSARNAVGEHEGEKRSQVL